VSEPAWIRWAIWGSEAAVALAAWRVVKTRSFHRGFARFATLAAVADPVRFLIARNELRPFRALFGKDVPYFGRALVAFHTEQALFLAYRAGLVALTLETLFHSRRAWPAALAGLAAVEVVLVAAYPRLRGAALGDAYLALEVGVLVLCAALAVGWLRPRPPPARRDPPVVTELLLFAYLTVEVVVMLGPFAGSVFTDWPAAWMLYLALQLFAAAAQAVWLARRPQLL
jgi:hypothetical protein